MLVFKGTLRKSLQITSEEREITFEAKNFLKIA